MKLMFTILIACIVQFYSFGQSTMKNDVIVKLSGEEMIGKVQEIGDSYIKFIIPGKHLFTRSRKVILLK